MSFLLCTSASWRLCVRAILQLDWQGPTILVGFQSIRSLPSVPRLILRLYMGVYILSCKNPSKTLTEEFCRTPSADTVAPSIRQFVGFCRSLLRSSDRPGCPAPMSKNCSPSVHNLSRPVRTYHFRALDPTLKRWTIGRCPSGTTDIVVEPLQVRPHSEQAEDAENIFPGNFIRFLKEHEIAAERSPGWQV